MRGPLPRDCRSRASGEAASYSFRAPAAGARVLRDCTARGSPAPLLGCAGASCCERRSKVQVTLGVVLMLDDAWEHRHGEGRCPDGSGDVSRSLHGKIPLLPEEREQELCRKRALSQGVQSRRASSRRSHRKQKHPVLAERLRTAIEALRLGFREEDVRCTASMGPASFPEDGAEPPGPCMKHDGKRRCAIHASAPKKIRPSRI